jgi:hypothetical protein
MKRVVGQILRVVGLLIEMFGVIGVVTGRGDIEALHLRLSGGTVVSPAWIVLALGFVIWLVGTILIVGSKPKCSQL